MWGGEAERSTHSHTTPSGFFRRERETEKMREFLSLFSMLLYIYTLYVESTNGYIILWRNITQPSVREYCTVRMIEELSIVLISRQYCNFFPYKFGFNFLHDRAERSQQTLYFILEDLNEHFILFYFILHGRIEHFSTMLLVMVGIVQGNTFLWDDRMLWNLLFYYIIFGILLSWQVWLMNSLKLLER